MPSIYTWKTLPLVVPINHLDPLQRRKLATHESCCCDEGCPACTKNETCGEFGCVEDGGGVRNGWFDTYEHAKLAGQAATLIWCGTPGTACCSEAGVPCFVVGCDEFAPGHVPGDCYKYFWKICCDCCESCADAAPLPGAAGAGCVADDCTGGYGCFQDEVKGVGYCTASDAVNNVPFGAVECNGSNCDSGFGCYYITCDDTKCEDRFNWVTCSCQS